jgi:hypothetical protein
MPKFIVGTDAEPPISVTLEHDGDSLNILLNGIPVAWFDEDGVLVINTFHEDEDELPTLKELGVPMVEHDEDVERRHIQLDI